MPFPTKQIDLSEVHWLLDGGESVHQIARTMHVTVGGILRAAERARDPRIMLACRIGLHQWGEGQEIAA
jgi:hypothetical protein